MSDVVGLCWNGLALCQIKSRSRKRSKKSPPQFDFFASVREANNKRKISVVKSFLQTKKKFDNFSFDSIDENSQYDVKNVVNKRLEEQLMKGLKRKELAFNDNFQAFQGRKRSTIGNYCRKQHQINYKGLTWEMLDNIVALVWPPLCSTFVHSHQDAKQFPSRRPTNWDVLSKMLRWFWAGF